MVIFHSCEIQARLFEATDQGWIPTRYPGGRVMWCKQRFWPLVVDVLICVHTIAIYIRCIYVCVCVCMYTYIFFPPAHSNAVVAAEHQVNSDL